MQVITPRVRPDGRRRARTRARPAPPVRSGGRMQRQGAVPLPASPDAQDVLVTQIRARPRSNRVEVRLDGAAPLELTPEHAAGLVPGQRLEPERLRALRLQSDTVRALERGLRLVAVRPRSRAEVAGRLERAGIDPRAVESALLRMEHGGLLDDALFARWWVQDRCAHRPRSRRALACELAARGVPRAAIEAALGGIDDLQTALELAMDRAPRLAGLDRPVFDARLGAWLGRRGFSEPVIRRALETSWRRATEGTT